MSSERASSHRGARACYAPLWHRRPRGRPRCTSGRRPPHPLARRTRARRRLAPRRPPRPGITRHRPPRRRPRRPFRVHCFAPNTDCGSCGNGACQPLRPGGQLISAYQTQSFCQGPCQSSADCPAGRFCVGTSENRNLRLAVLVIRERPWPRITARRWLRRTRCWRTAAPAPDEERRRRSGPTACPCGFRCTSGRRRTMAGPSTDRP